MLARRHESSFAGTATPASKSAFRRERHPHPRCASTRQRAKQRGDTRLFVSHLFRICRWITGRL
jgi:hypothetical protein